jgi:hypothetical protein
VFHQNPIKGSVARYLVLSLSAAQLMGCSLDAEEADDASLNESHQDLAQELAQDIKGSPGGAELIIRGRRYVLRSTLSKEELAKMSDPALWEAPETVDKLAQLLRGNISHEYGDYVEAEPNYELARVSLGLDEPRGGARGGPPSALDGQAPPVVEKGIMGTDDRFGPVVGPNTVEAAYGMNEASGTGTMVGWDHWTVYTAGHVMYSNATIAGTPGWRCRNGSTSTASPPCPSPQLSPRWRFGGNWLGCGYKNVPTGWRNLPSNASTLTKTRWDYAYQNLEGCIPAGVGAVGWWVIDQATLRTVNFIQGGFPAFYTCPANSAGISNAPSGDCPLNGAGQGVAQLAPSSGFPLTGGTFFWTNFAFEPSVTVSGGAIVSTTTDITTGHSGGGVVVFDSGTWAIGNASRVTTSANYFNHLTYEVRDFIFQ